MRCEGCAAKLPGDTLTSSLGHQFEDGAVLNDQGPSRIRSIDALSYLIDDPYLVGVLAMRHAVSDVWAMGATPNRALTLTAVERAISKRLEADEFAQAFAVKTPRVPTRITPADLMVCRHVVVMRVLAGQQFSAVS